MTRSFRYRLSPTRAQQGVLMEWSRLTRELYNAALQERREAWRKQRKSVSLYDQMAQLPAVRGVRPEYVAVPILVLRGALRRLDRAFQGFYRRCVTGEDPGYPRFQGRDRWASSIQIDDFCKVQPVVAGGKRVHVPLLGKVKFKQHRPIQGTPKTMQIKLGGDGKWYVTFACVDVPAKPLPPTGAEIGVDVGLSTFAATSDGEMFDNPRPLASARLEMERAQRRVSRRKRGSSRHGKAVAILRRKHLHVANVRRENHIRIARALVANYDTIYVEDLNTKGLVRGMLAKSVRDAAWSGFRHWLDVKAEEAGRTVVGVDPYGTSKTCSNCGVEGPPIPLSIRIFKCGVCGFTLDRDVNAAINIKRLGQSLQGAAPLVEGRLRSEKPRKRAGPVLCLRLGGGIP